MNRREKYMYLEKTLKDFAVKNGLQVIFHTIVANEEVIRFSFTKKFKNGQEDITGIFIIHINEEYDEEYEQQYLDIVYKHALNFFKDSEELLCSDENTYDLPYENKETDTEVTIQWSTEDEYCLIFVNTISE